MDAFGAAGLMEEGVAVEVLGVDGQAEAAHELDDAAFVGPEPGGAQVQAVVTVPMSQQSTTDSITSFEHDHVASAAVQGVGHGEAADAGTHDDRLHL